MRYILALISIIIFWIYITAVPPTIYLGDSGEIVAGAYTLGIAHPPGYPLYMLISKAFISFMPADPAMMMNVLSGALGVLFFLCLYNLCVYILGIWFEKSKGREPELAGLIISLVFVFSYIFWFNANNAKGGVYMLTLIVESLALLYCARAVNGGKGRDLMSALYLSGFLPALHHSSALVMLFILAILAFNAKKFRTDAIVNGAALFVMSFFTPYLYLFIRAAAGPVVWWREIRTFGDVLGHILRKTYLSYPDVPLNYYSFTYKLKNYIGQFAFSYKFSSVFLFTGLFAMWKKAGNGSRYALASSCSTFSFCSYLPGIPCTR